MKVDFKKELKELYNPKVRAFPHIGKGDKNAADGAAVDAMQAFLNTFDLMA